MTPLAALVSVVVAGVWCVAASEVVYVDESNFDTVCPPGDTCFVLIYVDWCPHCRRFHEPYDQIAAELEGAVKVVKIDGDKCGSLKNRFSISQYPTLCLIEDGTQVYYEGQRDVAAVTQWVRGKIAA